MKRNQKRLGNKGFSLVELIVVIAIMAVLVGVLAPTLIGNIEKSRESKDVQNLSEMQRGIVTALADEKANAAIPSTGTYKITEDGLEVVSATGANVTEFNSVYNNIVKYKAMTCKAIKDQPINVSINNGVVRVWVDVKSGETIKSSELKFDVE